MNVTVNISREKVMSTVEGISVTISRKSGGSIPFERLWASADERAKLDVYYREAVGDLEGRLTTWLRESTAQFDLDAEGTDYSLVLRLHWAWPEKLTGLLRNKVQDYVVHSVTAGWLNDFEGLNVKEDYTAMAAGDLEDIAWLVMQKAPSFVEAVRQGDGDEKPDSDAAVKADERQGDGDEKPDSDAAVKADERQGDGDEKPDSDAAVKAEARRRDTVKDGGDGNIVATAARRTDSELKKHCTPWRREAAHRITDDCIVNHGMDCTDWSGTGLYGRPAAELPGTVTLREAELRRRLAGARVRGTAHGWGSLSHEAGRPGDLAHIREAAAFPDGMKPERKRECEVCRLPEPTLEDVMNGDEVLCKDCQWNKIHGGKCGHECDRECLRHKCGDGNCPDHGLKPLEWN